MIVGFGARTGLAAARALEAQHVRYRISDQADLDTLGPLRAGLRVETADVFTGPQEPTPLEGVSCVLLSPGVPRSIPPVRAAAQRGIPVVVELDFLYPLFAHKRSVAITGPDR